MLNPQTNCEKLGLQPGMQVAELGAGAGKHSIAAARLVGEKGHVFALDVQRELLETVKRSAKEDGALNIEAVWADIERPNGTRLQSNSIDAALIVNTLFQIEDQAGLARETARIVRDGGRLLVVDWNESYNNMGPPENHVISYDRAREVFELAGFQHEHDIDAGDTHYGFIMKHTDS